jgi:hypothetical protein
MKKIFSGNVKSQPDGELSCIFSTMEVIDFQGDIVKKGAFGKQSVRIRPWNHDLSGPPIGEGLIEEHGNQAIMTGHLFMSMISARDHFEAMRQLKSIEWSYQFDIDRFHFEKIDGKEIRILEKLNVFSVDPVDHAASIGTQLLSIKSYNRGTWLSVGMTPSNARAEISKLMPPQIGDLAKSLDDLCNSVMLKELETLEARLKESGGPLMLDAWRLQLRREGHSDNWIEAIIESEIAGLEKQVLDQNPLLEYQPGAAHAQVLRMINRPIHQGFFDGYPEAGFSVRSPVFV